jgi:hypothetical protein
MLGDELALAAEFVEAGWIGHKKTQPGLGCVWKIKMRTR